MVENHWLPSVPDPNASAFYPKDILCSEHNLGLGVSGAFHGEPPFGAPWSHCSRTSPSDRRATASHNASAAYTPLYYAGAVPFYLLAAGGSVEVRLAAVRVWSVLLGVAAAVFAYLAFSWAFTKQKGPALAATILFILQPMNSQQTAFVTNDALLIALAAAFWWRFYRGLAIGVSHLDGLVLGAVVGLAYLAKPQGLSLAALIPVLVLLTSLRGSFKQSIGRVLTVSLAGLAPIVIALLMAIGYTSLSHNYSLPAHLPGVHGLSQYLALFTANGFQRTYFLLVSSFWGYFGWFAVDLPPVVYVAIALLVITGLVGAVVLLFKADSRRLLVIASFAGLVIPTFLIVALEAYYYRVSGLLILEGRSFLIVLIPLIVLLLSGWQRLLPRPAAAYVPAAATLAALGLNLAAIIVLVNAFYG